MEKKTNFSLACSLLSKMVKEKGSFADLGLANGMHSPPATMNLLRALEVVSADNKSETYDTENVTDRNATKCMDLFPVGKGAEKSTTSTSPPPPLTIVYGGSVFVFDEFPADKADTLMRLASNASPSAALSAGPADPLPEGCPSTSGSLPAVKLYQGRDALLAQKRSASLHRFLNKRKERLNAAAPYQINDSPKKMNDAAKPKATARPKC